jgi:hypothetical protein
VGGARDGHHGEGGGFVRWPEMRPRRRAAGVSGWRLRRVVAVSL